MSQEEAIEQAVNNIVSDISDRSGLGDEWDAIDSGIQDEIKEEWRSIIRESLKGTP